MIAVLEQIRQTRTARADTERTRYRRFVKKLAESGKLNAAEANDFDVITVSLGIDLDAVEATVAEIRTLPDLDKRAARLPELQGEYDGIASQMNEWRTERTALQAQRRAEMVAKSPTMNVGEAERRLKEIDAIGADRDRRLREMQETRDGIHRQLRDAKAAAAAAADVRNRHAAILAA